MVGATLAGGCPRDDIDLRWIDTAAELVGQVAHDAAPVTKLEPDDELFGQADELGGCNDPRRGDYRRRRRKGELAPTTQLEPRLTAPCTTIDQHATVVTTGCDKDGGFATVLVVVFSSNPATAREYAPSSASADWANRLARCAFGLALFGAGIALILQAHLGAAPWDMLHQGLSNKTGISVGVIIEAVGFVLLLLWIPLKQRPGVGTILNAFEIGFVVDLVAPHLPDSDRLVVRAGYLVAGILIIAIGSGFYIGAGLGPGPRDGLMLGLEQRGLSVRTARTAIELSVGIGAIALGVRPGVGTLMFMFGIGPLVQLTLPPLALPPRETRSAIAARTALAQS